MIKWKAGDIITDERWNKLNNVYPIAKKITSNNNVFDIQYDTLADLINHGTIIWEINSSDNINNIYRINSMIFFSKNENGYAEARK